jgi:hypothetical protein
MRRLVTTTLLLTLAAGCPESPSPRDAADLTVDQYSYTFPDATDLLAPDLVAPGSDRCLGAAAITLANGKATVVGTTVGAANEFGTRVRCGEATGFAGPQRYYTLAMTAKTTYSFELKPEFDALLYLFSECSRTLINVDCASGGATGAFSGPIAAKGTGGFAFTPTASGTYVLAVDSASSSSSGTFELLVEERTTAAHAACAGAEALTFTGSSATVQDSTLGAKNEFDTVTCGLAVTFDGPQLYYTVDLQGGSWYRFTLEPQFYASLYVAASAGGCQAANIEADCGGIGGTVLPAVPAGAKGATAFRPKTSGSYLVVVDSSDANAAGDFVLTVEDFTPPANMTCEDAVPLTLVGGQVSLSADSSTHLNDLGTVVACGLGQPLVGPQAYYTVDLEVKPYKLLLKPSFAAVLAAGSGCLTLPADCASGGAAGGAVQVPAGAIGSLLLTPTAAGPMVLSVEGTSVAAAGPFTLQVQEHVQPTHGVCTQPKPLTLATSPLEELGDTGPMKNDLLGVSCGHPQGPWPGPQAYYQLSLKGGLSYTVTVIPEPTFDPALYAFVAGTACFPSDVDAACQNLASDVVGAGAQESLTLAPATDTDYVLVVDAWSPSAVGSYTLQVSWP